MLRLILLRHAKAVAEQPDLADFNRPLAPRGREAAPLLGAFLARERLFPDRALVSAARRTRETFAALLPSLDHEMEALFTRDVYDAMDRDYLALARRLAGPARTLLIVGHNPAAHDTATALVGRGPQDLVASLEARFPTGSVAAIEIPSSSWPAMQRGSGRLLAFVRPRDLGGPEGD